MSGFQVIEPCRNEAGPILLSSIKGFFHFLILVLEKSRNLAIFSISASALNESSSYF